MFKDMIIGDYFSLKLNNNSNYLTIQLTTINENCLFLRLKFSAYTIIINLISMYLCI